MKTFFDRVRRILIWIPVLTMTLGLAVTILLYQVFKNHESEYARHKTIEKAQNITDRIDLSLANSILRIQAYEEGIGVSPQAYRQKGILFFRSALPHTVFQRLTIFQEKRSHKMKKEGGVNVVFRMTLPNSSLPQDDSDYLSAEDFYPQMLDMRKRSHFFQAFLYERGGQVRLAVVMKSKIHFESYFLFTTPISSLFKDTDLAPDDLVRISRDDAERHWILENIGADKNLRIVDETNFTSGSQKIDFQESSVYYFQQSGLPITLQFRFSEVKYNVFRSSNIVLIMGVIITLVASFLFYQLITQARRTQSLLKIRTVDLEKTAHDLQDALEAKNQFLGKVSHEIRTPLNLILGMIDLCQEQDMSEKANGYLRSMKLSGDHLLYMIDDLIDLAKSDNNQLQFYLRSVNTVAFFADIVRMIGQTCQKKKLKLYFYADPNLPHSFICDPNRLRQIIMNLLRNATKYTQSGYIVFRIYYEKTEGQKRGQFLFEIEDTGAGIPKDKVGRIFDAFFQVESHLAKSEGGAGLGLSIVRDLVHNMNGQVDVVSKVGKGSIFRVRLNFDEAESKTWTKSFQSVDRSDHLIYIVSKDPLFMKTFSVLNSVERLVANFIPPEQFIKTLEGKAEKIQQGWIVLDDRDAQFDLNDVFQKYEKHRVLIFKDFENEMQSYKSQILSIWPCLASDLLIRTGYSARARDLQDVSRSKHSKSSKGSSLKVPTDLKIVVADDDHGNLELYRAYFDSTGWNAIYVDNGRAAYEAFEKEKPDVCILDLRMPEMDGFEVTQKIRDLEKNLNWATTPILLVTADLIEMNLERANQFQSVTLLTKPIRKGHLLSVIGNLTKEQTKTGTTEHS